MQRKWMYTNAWRFGLHHKENAQCCDNSCKQCFFSKKALHWANVCFRHYEYYRTEL